MKDLYKYGKAKGELLVRKYLPKRCPFESIDIISTIKEWEAIKDNYREFIFNRVDYPIGKAEKNVAELTSDNPDSIPDLIKKGLWNFQEIQMLHLKKKKPLIIGKNLHKLK